ncbi:MAG: ArsA family ATPase [Microbacteriaceae bacterium]|nr:ArsA family ATPase [Microbacteriaceae bacterium]
MLRELVSARRVLFLGGKGGVGKTTTASAIALDQSRAGRRVLLVSTDPAHNLGHLWGTAVGPTPTPLAERLDGIEIDPDAAAAAHLEAVGQTLHELMPEHLRGEVDRYLRLSAASPGAHEAAMLERIAELVDTGMRDYDLVVFDTAPSGHTARLMSLPEAMGQWTEALLDNRRRSDRFGEALRGLGAGVVGADDDSPRDQRERRDQRIRHILFERRDKLERLRTTLADGGTTAFVIALAAERLPVLETIELRGQLADSGVGVAALVVNKRSPADGGELLAARHEMEEGWMRRLRDEVGALPIVETPLLAAEPVGAEALAGFAAHLLGDR